MGQNRGRTPRKHGTSDGASIPDSVNRSSAPFRYQQKGAMMAKDDKQPTPVKPTLIPATDEKFNKGNEISNTLKPARPTPRPPPDKPPEGSKDGSD